MHWSALEVVAASFARRQKERVWIASYTTPSAMILTAAAEGERDVRLVLNGQTSRPAPILGSQCRYWHGQVSMHHKFIVGDDSVLFGSYNFSGPGKHDAFVELDGPCVAEFAQVFEDLWATSSASHAAYTTGDLRTLLDAVVKSQRRWTPFTSSLSRTLSASGSLSQGQIRALLKAYHTGYGRYFKP